MSRGKTTFRSCIYAIRLCGDWCCDYLSITKHCRPRDADGACLARKTAAAEARKGWQGAYRMPGSGWDKALAREFYDKGWNDRKIAEAVGVSGVTIFTWRHSNGLPANRKRREAVHG